MGERTEERLSSEVEAVKPVEKAGISGPGLFLFLSSFFLFWGGNRGGRLLDFFPVLSFHHASPAWISERPPPHPSSDGGERESHIGIRPVRCSYLHKTRNGRPKFEAWATFLYLSRGLFSACEKNLHRSSGLKRM